MFLPNWSRSIRGLTEDLKKAPSQILEYGPENRETLVMLVIGQWGLIWFFICQLSVVKEEPNRQYLSFSPYGVRKDQYATLQYQPVLPGADIQKRLMKNQWIIGKFTNDSCSDEWVLIQWNGAKMPWRATFVKKRFYARFDLNLSYLTL